MTPLQYCQMKVAPPGSSFYYSLRYTSEHHKNNLIALHAFEAEISAIRFECSDIQVAKQKLQWWRTEIVKLFSGAPQHPVTQALTSVIHSWQLPIELFYTFIDHAENELRPAPFENSEDWLQHYQHAPSMIKTIILREHTSKLSIFAHHLDMAFQLSSMLTSLRQTCQAGFVLLPLADLEKYEVSTESLLQMKMSKNLEALLEVYRQKAIFYFTQALKNLPISLRVEQLNYVILAELEMRLLAAIAADKFPIFEKETTLTPLYKLWVTLTHKKA